MHCRNAPGSGPGASANDAAHKHARIEWRACPNYYFKCETATDTAEARLVLSSLPTLMHSMKNTRCSFVHPALTPHHVHRHEGDSAAEIP